MARTVEKNAQVTIHVVGAGEGSLEHALVTIRTTDGGLYSSRTDSGGVARVSLPRSALRTLNDVLVQPRSGFLPERLPAHAELPSEVTCSPIEAATAHLGWWHLAIGIGDFATERGSAVTIGVIDSGVSSHPSLGHVRSVGQLVDMAFNEDEPGLDPLFGVDRSGHGTHVCGIIGARPLRAHEYTGIAPGSAVLSLSVCDRDRDSGSSDDTAEAIELLSRVHEADIINISMSIKEDASEQTCEILETAISEAFERGTLCVCAAGNRTSLAGSQAIGAPANCSRSVAVTALGASDVARRNSYFAACMPRAPEWMNREGMFVAGFCRTGPAVTCCAPGVAIVSTARRHSSDGPTDAPQVAMSGTSMAAPVVTALLAATLAEDRDYQALPRTGGRATHALDRLRSLCVKLGFPSDLEGLGAPRAGVAPTPK